MANQMWHDPPLKQSKRTTKRTMGVEVGGEKKMFVCLGGIGQNLKKEGLGNIRGRLSQNRGVSTPLPTM